jgi:hypothetical protein
VLNFAVCWSNFSLVSVCNSFRCFGLLHQMHPVSLCLFHLSSCLFYDWPLRSWIRTFVHTELTYSVWHLCIVDVTALTESLDCKMIQIPLFCLLCMHVLALFLSLFRGYFKVGIWAAE